MPRKRMAGYEREVTESSPGVYEWVCGPFRWRWTAGHGLNLARVLGDGTAVPLVFCKDLAAAGMFAEGYTAGEALARSVEVKDE